MPFRKKRAIERDGVEEDKVEETITRMDKRRANYYNYHAAEKWGTVTNYHLAIQNDFRGVDKTVEVIKKFIDSID